MRSQIKSKYILLKNILLKWAASACDKGDGNRQSKGKAQSFGALKALQKLFFLGVYGPYSKYDNYVIVSYYVIMNF